MREKDTRKFISDTFGWKQCSVSLPVVSVSFLRRKKRSKMVSSNSAITLCLKNKNRREYTAFWYLSKNKKNHYFKISTNLKIAENTSLL